MSVHPAALGMWNTPYRSAEQPWPSKSKLYEWGWPISVHHAFPWFKCMLIIALHVICLLYDIIMSICNWYVRVGIFLVVLQNTKFSHFLKLIGEKYLYSLNQKNFVKEIYGNPVCGQTKSNNRNIKEEDLWSPMEHLNQKAHRIKDILGNRLTSMKNAQRCHRRRSEITYLMEIDYCLYLIS